MSELGVGKEALSYCNKCKLNLAHLIVVMKSDTTIGKVECKTCKATHAYKDPSQVKAKKVKSKSGARRKSEASISDIWMEAVGKSNEKSQKYSPKSAFKKGDIIDHSKFGPGVIDRVFDGNKIEVIFRHSIKTLVHNL